MQNANKLKEKTQKKNNIETYVTRTNNRASSTPAAVMGSKAEQLDKLYDTLMVRMHTEKDTTLRSFLTLKTFVPVTSDGTVDNGEPSESKYKLYISFFKNNNNKLSNIAFGFGSSITSLAFSFVF